MSTASAATSRFVRACLRQPVDRTPVWFLRQAGRYMPEYMAVRRHHSLLQICRQPQIAAEVTITAAERLGVDAAIIFADLLLPFTPMGVDFEFVNGEGPVVHTPVRTLEQIGRLETDRISELGYVAEAISLVGSHFAAPRPPERPAGATHIGEAATGQQRTGGVGDRLGIIGFIGAPFTLASYMIEGGSSRNYVETKKIMYRSAQPAPAGGRDQEASAWPLLMEKLLTVLTGYAQQQVEAGADVIQIFDSWAGALSPTDYREFAFPATRELVRRVQAMGVPVILFGVDTATLLPQMRETGADVVGLDWRVPLDQGWRALGFQTGVQGNLDPITLFAPLPVIEARVRDILSQAGGRPGHIFNLGHGIVPGTPVDSVLHVVQLVKSLGLASGS